MASIIDDFFAGAAANIDGRVLSGHTWVAVPTGSLYLSGSGSVYGPQPGGGSAYLAMPELVGAVDFEVRVRVGVPPGAGETIAPRVTEGATVNGISLGISQSAVDVGGSMLAAPVSYTAPLLTGDEAAVRVYQTTGLVELLVGEIVVGTTTLASAAPTSLFAAPRAYLRMEDTSGAVTSATRFAISTVDAPPVPTSFWVQQQLAREVI